MSETTKSDKQVEEEPMTEEGKVKFGKSKNSDGLRQDSIRYKVIEARDQSQGSVSFVVAVLGIVIGSVVGLIGLALANLISIAQIVIGSLYIHDCTLSPGIPIILIVNGSVGVLESISESINKRLDVMSKQKGTDYENQSASQSTKLLQTMRIEVNILRTLAIISFIAWCVLVYGSNTPEFDNTEDDNYCHSTLYLFAFWLLNAYFIIIAILVCCCICCCFCAK